MDKNVNQPLVSVIMAAKNTEHFIGQAIQSVLDQTYRYFELIIVDDGSTDKTREVIKDFAKKDNRIRTIFNDVSLLPPLARNLAIKQSTGKYLAILDADDVCMPNRLERQVAFMENHSDVLACGAQAEIIDESGKTIGIKRKSTNVPDIRFTMLTQNRFMHSSMMFRKDIFDSLGGYRAEFPFAEDYDLISRILEKGIVTNIDEVLIKFRVNTQGATIKTETSNIQRESSLKVSMRNCSFFINISMSDLQDLTDVLNEKKMTLSNTLNAIKEYRSLILAYIDKNKIGGDDRAKIYRIYTDKHRMIWIMYFKKLFGINS